MHATCTRDLYVKVCCFASLSYRHDIKADCGSLIRDNSLEDHTVIVRQQWSEVYLDGAGKSRTTWLWENLNLHPQVWVPPIKELHWFDVLFPPTQMAGRPGYQHRQGLRRFGPFLRYPSWSTIAWLRRFYAGLAAGEGYCSLFPRAPWSVTGDITPAYAILDDAVVRLVQNTVPADCRIVFIMRNPVDRLWSALRMHCRNRGMSVSSLTEHELYDLSLQPEHTLRSDYVRTLEHWSMASGSGFSSTKTCFGIRQTFWRAYCSSLALMPVTNPGAAAMSNVGKSRRRCPTTCAIDGKTDMQRL